MRWLGLRLDVQAGILESPMGKLQFTAEEAIAEICGIEVKHRRRGIGTELVSHFEEFCRARGVTAVLVPASPTKMAISFWLKNGFSCYFSDDEKLIDRILKKRKLEQLTNTDSGIIALRKELR